MNALFGPPGEFRLGFVALADAAPLIVADRLGLFAEEGLKVTLSREVSWATIRDRLAAGLLDGAHMLAALALASRLGLGADPVDLIAPLALNAHGAAVTLSPALAARLSYDLTTPAPASAAPLREVIAARRAAGEPSLTFGVVFAVSAHAHLLRDWLAAGGIDPERDVRLRVLAPTAMVAALAGGELDGCCVGAPWPTMAEAAGLGRTVLAAGQLHPFAPDKAFVVRGDWATRNGPALAAMLRALVRAGLWANDGANREALVTLLAAPDAVGAEADILARALTADVAAPVAFGGERIARPRPDHAAWLLRQLQRWNNAPPSADAQGFYRPDLYDAALKQAPAPSL